MLSLLYEKYTNTIDGIITVPIINITNNYNKLDNDAKALF